MVNFCFGIFYKNTFSCAVVSLKVTTPKCYFLCPGFWIQMYREMHLCWRNTLAMIFSFHLSIICVFSWTLRVLAGISGINTTAVPLKSLSWFSLSTFSILIEPVYKSWGQKSLVETFHFSSFVTGIDKSSPCLSQDSESLCHYLAASAQVLLSTTSGADP